MRLESKDLRCMLCMGEEFQEIRGLKANGHGVIQRVYAHDRGFHHVFIENHGDAVGFVIDCGEGGYRAGIYP